MRTSTSATGAGIADSELCTSEPDIGESLPVRRAQCRTGGIPWNETLIMQLKAFGRLARRVPVTRGFCWHAGTCKARIVLADSRPLDLTLRTEGASGHLIRLHDSALGFRSGWLGPV